MDKESEIQFEVGKYYKHSNGDLAYQFNQRDTVFHITARDRAEVQDLDMQGQPIQNWIEILEREYSEAMLHCDCEICFILYKKHLEENIVNGNRQIYSRELIERAIAGWQDRSCSNRIIYTVDRTRDGKSMFSALFNNATYIGDI